MVLALWRVPRSVRWMPTDLTSSQRAYLRGLAMNLKPSVTIGKLGLTDTAVRELDLALTRVELIKVRIAAANRDERAEVIGQIAARTSSTLCGAVGGTASFYRPSPARKIAV